LHLLAECRQDQLTFELQREVSEAVYGTADVERLLGRHYRHAQQVIDLKHRLFLRVDDELRPKRRSRRLHVAGDFGARPEDMLRVFSASLAQALPIADATLDALAHALHVIDDRFRARSDVAQLFWQIVDHPYGDHALVDMHATGVLGRY